MKLTTEILVLTLLCYIRIEAIQVIKVGHQETGESLQLPTAELFDTDTSISCLLSTGYFNHTANKYGDAGVTQGMVCNYIFDKGICCGGHFGIMNVRNLLRSDCAELTSSGSWVTLDNEIPQKLNFASNVPLVQSGAETGWIVSGGEDIYDEVQTKLYRMDSNFEWTTLDTDMPRARLAHCTVQINENEIAFIGGSPTKVPFRARISEIDVYNFVDNTWTEGPEIPEIFTNSARFACYKIPNENRVFFGCDVTARKLFTWDLGTNSMDEYGDCVAPEGIFMKSDIDTTLIYTGFWRAINEFTSSSGFSTTIGRSENIHWRGSAFNMPSGSLSCP